MSSFTDTDDDKQKRIKSYVIGQSTDDMSVDEVGETIAALHTEIERLETIKLEKSSHIDAASALFKS